jgi:hypothetical protein
MEPAGCCDQAQAGFDTANYGKQNHNVMQLFGLRHIV